MGIRESINRHQKLAVGAVAIVVLVAVGVSAFQQRTPTVSPPTYAYFTDDDGKTFFKDDATLVAPFDREGKEVVAAQVFQCKDGEPFVGYLERAASPQAKAAIEQAKQEMIEKASKMAVPMPDSELTEQITQNLEVKRPGDAKWLPAPSSEAGPVFDVKGPDGTRCEPVTP